MRYHNITKDDMLNGDGLRAVLWVAGCTHKCKGCHNPVTWDIEGGIPFDDAAKEELFEAIKPDYISGVTFSGGDPLHPANHAEVAVLAKEIKETFQRVIDHANKQQVDLLLIAGDLFDQPPTQQELREVDYLLSRLNHTRTVLIAGNHDHLEPHDVFSQYKWNSEVYLLDGKQRDHISFEDLETTIYGFSYWKNQITKPLYDRMKPDESESSDFSILLAHGGDESHIPIQREALKWSGFDYIALGHIHKPMKVGSELYRYCGTPLACSVSEAQQQKGIIMVEMGVKGEVKTTILPLEPLRQVKVVKGTLEEVLKESCKDYVTVILTDKADLDVIDMQERIRLAFPNLLEIRRENQRKTDYTRTLQTEELLDPYELCCSFLKDLDEEEKMILQDVLHTVQGVK